MTKSGNEARRAPLTGGPPPSITQPAEAANVSQLSSLHRPVRRGSRLLQPIFSNAAPAWLVGMLVLLCMHTVGLPGSARAADAIIQPGDAVVTGFSGIAAAGGGLAEGTGNPIDGVFIDPNGASARIFALPEESAPQGQEIPRTVRFEVKAGDIGQVFGVALDGGGNGVPSIYLTATSAFGLQLVQPGAAEDAPPIRTRQGGPHARWMRGQFGQEKGGGPGSIWKVDGASGEVSLFANIPGNSGPGLGNIAYSKAHGQFFVSDMDTGLIHRVSRDGQVLDSFDHGVTGRTAGGLPPQPDDGRRADIKNPAFDSGNPETWGLTPVERRVWGLAVHDGRLYYAVWAGPQVWSVSLDSSGAFGSDARLEFDVEGGGADAPVSGIVISRDGTVYIAQRGGISSSYDYSVFAPSKTSSVQRYRKVPETGQWTRDEYAIGMPPDFRNASGGVDLGRCDKLLWSTGDALRGLPGQPQEGGPRVIHGLQGSPRDLVRPANAPPLQASFLDYDGQYEDAQAEGHIGSVRIYRTPCQSESSEPAPAEMPDEEPDVEDIPEPECTPGEPGCRIPVCPPDRPNCCPPGTYWNGGVCCEHGRRCCPPDTRWNGRVCCPEGRHCCPPGSQWNGRVCCRDGRHCCPPGSHWNGHVCCPEGRHCCPPGQHWNGQTCLPQPCSTPSCCPRGTQWNPQTQSCGRPPEKPVCREGEIFAGGRCIHIRRCPDGHGIWPNCKQKDCPRGTQGTYPDCKKSKDDKPRHLKRASRIDKGGQTHSTAESRRDKPHHARPASRRQHEPQKKVEQRRKRQAPNAGKHFQPRKTFNAPAQKRRH
jgi:hypothetical protein